MSAQSPVPKDAPLMKAWEAYKDSEEYRNSRTWAGIPAHTDGSMWSAFVEGWKAAGAKVWPEPSAALLAEREPQPDLSNHHNALTCPYCNSDGLLRLAEREGAPAAPMDLEMATPLQRAIYGMCVELERLGASPFQTRLVALFSDANQEITRLRAVAEREPPPAPSEDAVQELSRWRFWAEYMFNVSSATSSQEQRDEIAASIKALERKIAASSAPLGPWQPIETAPLDGTWFLGWDYDCGFYVFRTGPGFIEAEEPSPTHWMPLPAPPSLAPSQETRI